MVVRKDPGTPELVALMDSTSRQESRTASGGFSAAVNGVGPVRPARLGGAKILGADEMFT